MQAPPEHPVVDPTREHPVALVLRPAFEAIVEALRRRDYALSAPIAMLDPVSAEDAQWMATYITDYGETITSLPDEAWTTSVSIWTGSHWHVLIDLWTAESGRSDMCLDARVYVDGSSYRISIHGVYVP